MTEGPVNTAARQATELIDTLRTQSTADLDTALTELVENALLLVPPAQFVGITLATPDGKVQTATASHEFAEALDDIQQRYEEGPCLSAAWDNHIIRVDDLTVEQRWPAYCRDATEQTPIRSIMCFQIFAGRHVSGALNFYAEQPHAFDADAVDLGLAVATHAALAWSMMRRDEQFRSALASRDIIGQAKGMLMERFDIGAVQAFEMLRRLSQESNTKLPEIARQLVDRAHPR